MQKQFLSVLIALSIPLVGAFAPQNGPVSNLLGPTAAQAANQDKKPAVDYNAGSSLSGDEGNDSSKSTASTSSGEAASDNSGTAGDATAGAAQTTTNAAQPDGPGSMDSMWSETPAAQTVKAKAKKKTHERSHNLSKSKAGKSKAEDLTTAPSNNAAVPGQTVQASPTGSTGSSPPETYTSQPEQSSSVLDRPVTLGTMGTAGGASSSSSAAAESQPAQEESPPETRPSARTATVQPSSAPPASSPATPRAERSSHPPDAVFTTKMSVGEHATPLCSTNAFLQSELIRSVSWPGVGPFKGDSDPNDLVDPQENKLTLQTSGDKVTSAELILLHQPGNPQGFINLEMVLDFMLEALGAKDRKINDFNTFLEKNKEILAKNKATEEKPLKTASGPYLISLAGSGKNNESSYLIQVKSKQSAEEASRAEATEAREESSTTKSGAVSVATTLPQNSSGNSGSNAGGTGGGVKTTKKSSETNIETTKPAAKTPIKPAKEAKPTEEEGGNPKSESGSADTLKQEFAETIRSWQTIKQEADKTRDVTLLAKVLTGKALAKQTIAINWLVKEKKYYEITPKGVSIDKYQEVSKSPSRYAVFAHVKELSRLLDDGTNKLNKETDDQYNVNYTLEKTGDRWSIYDSQLIQPTGQAAGTGQSKTTTTTKTKH